MRYFEINFFQKKYRIMNNNNEIKLAGRIFENLKELGNEKI